MDGVARTRTARKQGGKRKAQDDAAPVPSPPAAKVRSKRGARSGAGGAGRAGGVGAGSAAVDALGERAGLSQKQINKLYERPKVGVGVFVTSVSHPHCVLLGRRKGSDGSGTFALPGGHLEHGESVEECAARETLEETGLTVTCARLATVANAVDPSEHYHYLVLFARCDGWGWYDWRDKTTFPAPLFKGLAVLRDRGFDPFARAAALDAAGTLAREK